MTQQTKNKKQKTKTKTKTKNKNKKHFLFKENTISDTIYICIYMAIELPIFNIQLKLFGCNDTYTTQIHRKLETYQQLLGLAMLLDYPNRQYVCDVIKAWVDRMIQHHTKYDPTCEYAEYHCIERYAQYVIQMTLCLQVSKT
jgi:hypothetical protein